MTSTESLIATRFKDDKRLALENATNFLRTVVSPTAPSADEINIERSKVASLVAEHKFTEALESLEKIRDLKTGITQHLIVNNDGTPTLIRDARLAKLTPVRETESFEMQFLNTVRAGMDLAENNEALKSALQEKANEFFSENGFYLKHNLPQKELAKVELKNEINTLGVILGNHGISQAYSKLNVAKDFQNFNDKHANIVTISAINDGNKSATVIEAEVALKGLTTHQQQEYDAINNEITSKPNWYQAMPNWEQNLCKKYAPLIAKGEHVIPTQLRQIAGMKNAFEKTTAIYDPSSSELEVLHQSKHAGTLASFARNKDQRQTITEDNARQAQEWVGTERKLHCNTFNSGPIGAGNDPEIVRRTKDAMLKVGGSETNTAFNSFRLIGRSSEFSGVKKTLSEISKSLGEDRDFKKLKAHIEPKGFFGRIFRRGNPKDAINLLLTKDKINQQTASLLSNAIELSKKIEQADKFIRFGDGENLSLQISTKLNLLTEAISRSPDNAKLSLPKEEILNMCASGKDRTGLAEHDQTAQILSTRLGIPPKNIDKQLLAGGHTAQQAGGVYSGGATIGCHGTKSENRAGIPESRRKELEGIVEDSASTNKVKGNSKKADKLIAKKQVAKASSISPSPTTVKPKISHKKPLVGLPITRPEIIGEAKAIGKSLQPSSNASQNLRTFKNPLPSLKKSDSQPYI